jgi:hypothetical protein
VKVSSVLVLWNTGGTLRHPKPDKRIVGSSRDTTCHYKLATGIQILECLKENSELA